MSSNYVEGAQPNARARSWALGLGLTALLSLLAGVLMAGLVNGVPQPWTGLAFVLAIALAIVTGVSKTSSA
jgi:hypothetical protein